MKHKFPYNWTLKDANFTKDKGKVFSCFSCCGGSTMGYKLAGFDVIGCNEIDKRLVNIYDLNHHPKMKYVEPIQTFRLRDDLPEELYHLDILDGSPPCSTFSVASLNREDFWGEKKKFREGQVAQVLDELFFEYIALAKKLQPKVVVAENVKGLLGENAEHYVKRIYKDFDDAGYYCQHFLLDASKMGVPQKRERVFFLCLRKDLAGPFLKHVSLFDVRPYINMSFNEEPILYKEIKDGNGKTLQPAHQALYIHRIDSDGTLSHINERLYNGKPKFFNTKLIKDDDIPLTLTAAGRHVGFDTGRYFSDREVLLTSSFPVDYEYKNLTADANYFCGMSVPPVMMAQVASRIWEYWLSKL